LVDPLGANSLQEMQAGLCDPIREIYQGVMP